MAGASKAQSNAATVPDPRDESLEDEFEDLGEEREKQSTSADSNTGNKTPQNQTTTSSPTTADASTDSPPRVPTEQEENDALHDQDVLLQIARLKLTLKSPRKRARDSSDDTEDQDELAVRRALETQPGRPSFARLESSLRKKSVWGSIKLADGAAVGQGCEIPSIIVKTLAKGRFVPLADLLPAVLAAAATGRVPFRTKRVKLEGDLVESEVVDSGDELGRDAMLNKGDWTDAYTNLMRALQHPDVDMSKDQQSFFSSLRDYLLQHRHALDGTHWSIIAKADVRARQAFFAFPRTFNSIWIQGILDEEYMHALAVASAQPYTGGLPAREAPTISNSRTRKASQAMNLWQPNTSAEGGQRPFRASTGQRPSRCWICKGSHRASECTSTNRHHGCYDTGRKTIVRTADQVRFCGNFNQRGVCSMPQCAYAHECITCGSGAHSASQGVC